jgi:hypothetical protein
MKAYYEAKKIKNQGGSNRREQNSVKKSLLQFTYMWNVWQKHYLKGTEEKSII